MIENASEGLNEEGLIRELRVILAVGLLLGSETLICELVRVQVSAWLLVESRQDMDVSGVTVEGRSIRA